MDAPHSEVDLVIIGAGVLGLSIAEAVSRRSPRKTIVVVERHSRFGQESSSHLSEVIHAGLYYKDAPNKAAFCVSGNRALYQFCDEHGIHYKRCGKYLVATDEEQSAALHDIHATALKNGAEIQLCDRSEIRRHLDNPRITDALWSPSTGIVDSHGLMQTLERLSSERGVIFLYESEFLSSEPATSQCLRVNLQATAPRGGQQSFVTRALVNSGGLASARIAQAFHPELRLETRPCRGRYFALSERWKGAFSQLIYPVPDPAGGLGVHVTFDLSGRCRLGPDVDWSHASERPDDHKLYQFLPADEQRLQNFFEAGKRLIPKLEREDLRPESVGVRPKLFINDQAFPDFRILQSSEAPLTLHLLGIESPGLTSSLSLASHIAERVAAGWN